VPSIQIEKNGNHALIELREPLALNFAGELREQLRQLLAEGIFEMSIDLAAVDLVDSSGIGLLIATHNSLIKAGGSLRVVGVSPEIQHLFKTMRLDRHFAVEGKTGNGSGS
jgi:anti-anti-sigma factor